MNLEPKRHQTASFGPFLVVDVVAVQNSPCRKEPVVAGRVEVVVVVFDALRRWWCRRHRSSK
jgi:hypothetical protein